MAKSGNMKWSLIIVAVLILFIYQRQRAADPALTQSATAPQPIASLNQAPDAATIYTSVPQTAAPMQMEEPSEWLGEREDDSAEVPVPDFNFDEFEELESDSAEQPEAIDLETDHKTNQHLPERLPLMERVPANTDQAADELTRVQQGEPSRRKAIQRVELPRGVQIKVVHHIEYGKSLARRGAIFGARNEFQAALRLVARSIDNQLRTQDYSARLFRAMTALREADDFYFAQAENDGRVDVPEISARHQSAILNQHELAGMTPMDAMQAYYRFVQTNLMVCGGHNVVAGEALYCLGKLHSMNSSNGSEGNRLDNAKAIVFHSAAVQCDPQNFKSSNELGVLYAKTGRLGQAKQMLLRSLKVKQLPQVWENLARVHHQLGEQNLAKLASDEYRRMLQGPATGQASSIRWVSPQKFADQSSEPVELRDDARTARRPASQAQSNRAPEKQSSIGKAVKSWF